MHRPRVPVRLDRTARLLGEEAMGRLAAAHVVVLGIGGVGTFAAEALVRAGVGHVTLVDGERIEETNANRQLHALDGALGRLKAEAMAERLARVNPAARIEPVCEPYAALGLHFSFAGPLTYERARRPAAAARAVPRDRLLLETDAPDQTPRPHRGRNEPSFLVDTAAALAAALGIAPAEVDAITSENARRLFGP